MSIPVKIVDRHIIYGYKHVILSYVMLYILIDPVLQHNMLLFPNRVRRLLSSPEEGSTHVHIGNIWYMLYN